MVISIIQNPTDSLKTYHTSKHVLQKVNIIYMTVASVVIKWFRNKSQNDE